MAGEQVRKDEAALPEVLLNALDLDSLGLEVWSFFEV
jgi:hypothetical protein